MDPLISFLDPLVNGAKTVVGIGGLIFVHELGHFLVGRWCGIRAEAFSIGFGKPLLRYQKSPTSTEYRLCMLPLGGYVKFFADQPDEEGGHEPDSFHAATYPRKVATMLAGVAMNVLAAFLLFIVAFTNGVEARPAIAGDVLPGQPAWAAGIQAGDRFVRVNGDEPTEFTDLVHAVSVNEEVRLEIERDGKLLPEIRIATGVADRGIGSIGVGEPFSRDGRMAVLPKSPAELAGFKNGDRVIGVEGTPVTSYEAAEDIHQNRATASQWTVVRDGAELELTMPYHGTEMFRIGVMFDVPVIGGVLRGSIAEEAGLRRGDAPLRVGKVPTPTAESTRRAILDGDVAGPLVVQRGGEEITVDLPPTTEGRAQFAASLGSGPWNAREGEIWVSPFEEDESRARDAGMPAGSKLISMDGKPVTTNEDVQTITAEAGKAGRSLQLSYLAPTGELVENVEIVPARVQLWNRAETGVFAQPLSMEIQTSDVFAAAGLGLHRTHSEVMRILNTLGSMFSGNVSPKKLSGPIAIAKYSYRFAEQGLSDFFLFLGMISLNLAVLNLLPVPVLDGGQIVLITAEKIRGQPLPMSVQIGIQYAGLILIVGLMLFVIGNDIINL